MENYIINWHVYRHSQNNNNTQIVILSYVILAIIFLLEWLHCACDLRGLNTDCQEVFWMIKVKRILAHTITMIFLYYKLLQPCDNTSKLQIMVMIISESIPILLVSGR